VYGMRRGLLEGLDQKGRSWRWCRHRPAVCGHPLPREQASRYLGDGDLRNDILTQFGFKIDLTELSNLNRDEIIQRHLRPLQQKYQERKTWWARDTMRHAERMVMLQVIDNQWKDHLLTMDEPEAGIGNRGVWAEGSLVEYKKES